MGLFGGSKSNSSSTVTTNTQQTSSSVGDLSSNNQIYNGDYAYQPVGIAGDELFGLLDWAKELVENTTATNEKALSTTQSYTDRQNNKMTAFIQDLKPILIVGLFVVGAIFVMPKMKW